LQYADPVSENLVLGDGLSNILYGRSDFDLPIQYRWIIRRWRLTIPRQIRNVDGTELNDVGSLFPSGTSLVRREGLRGNVGRRLSGISADLCSFGLCDVLAKDKLCLGYGSVHRARLRIHDLQLTVIDKQSSNADDSQTKIYYHRDNFNQSDFSGKLSRGCVSITIGWLLASLGGITWWYGGRWWQLPCRIVVGTLFWIVALIVTIHGASLIITL
jgi:hypothetical protein